MITTPLSKLPLVLNSVLKLEARIEPDQISWVVNQKLERYGQSVVLILIILLFFPLLALREREPLQFPPLTAKGFVYLFFFEQEETNYVNDESITISKKAKAKQQR